MSQQILTNLDFNSVSRIINLPAPSASTDAATKGYVDSAVEGLAWKAEVKCAASSNITLTAPGATIDGQTMVANDRFLALAQTNAYDCGIYIWNGASTAATRSYDCTNANDFYNAVVSVLLGTSSGTTYRQTATSITVGTTSIVWSLFGTAAPSATTGTAGIAALATAAQVNTGTSTNTIVTPATLATYTGLLHKYTTTVGDGSSTSYTVTHNLGTQDVAVEVYRTTGSYDKVFVETDHTTTNSITLVFSSAPSSGLFKVVVIG